MAFPHVLYLPVYAAPAALAAMLVNHVKLTHQHLQKQQPASAAIKLATLTATAALLSGSVTPDSAQALSYQERMAALAERKQALADAYAPLSSNHARHLEHTVPASNVTTSLTCTLHLHVASWPEPAAQFPAISTPSHLPSRRCCSSTHTTRHALVHAIHAVQPTPHERAS